MKKIYAFLCAALMMCGSAMAETIEIEFENVEWADVVLGQGWWQLWGYNADSTYYVNISPNYTDHLDGTYDNSEMYFSKMYDMTSVKQIDFVSGSHTLVTTDRLVTLTSDVTGSDGNHYLLTIHHTIPEPEPVVIELDVPQATVQDNTATDNWWQIWGYAADSMCCASFSTLSDPRLAGSFTMADMDNDYTYFKSMPGTQWSETVKFSEGTIEVSVEGGDTLLVANMVGKNGYYYNITMSALGDAVSIQQIQVSNQEGIVEKIYDKGQLYIRRNDKSWTVNGARK